MIAVRQKLIGMRVRTCITSLVVSTFMWLLCFSSPFFLRTVDLHSLSKPSSRDKMASSKIKNARVVVATVWTHYPEMMRMQVASLRTYLQHDFIYVAVINTDSEEVYREIREAARNISVLYYRHPFQQGAGPSTSHALTLNDALSRLLHNGEAFCEISDCASANMLKEQAGNAGSENVNNIMVHPSDILFFLDSDMFLVSPMDLHDELQGGQLLTLLQYREGESRRVHYLWPNLSVLYFGGTPQFANRTLPLLREVNFMHDCRTDGAIMDSGACTSIFLDNHQHEFQLAEFAVGCSIDVAPEDVDVCQFMKRQNAIPRPPQCTTAYIIENRALHGTYTGSSPSAYDSGKNKTPYERMAINGNSSTYKGHGKIYHLGMYDYHDSAYYANP